jgi:hypothetical protein
MAGHHLIDDYLAILARRLPADAVDELGDGLTETNRHYLARGLDPERAAQAAIAEFGAPDVVLAAFVRESPGRRAARALLVSGPVVGICWGAGLIAGHAWTSGIPLPVKVAAGATLLAVIVALAIAATSRHSYRRTKVSAIGGLGLILLDLTMLSAVVLAAVPIVWPMVLAIPASATRLALTSRAFTRLLLKR